MALFIRHKKKEIPTLIQDLGFPWMWRLKFSDGTVSDMVNLTRAKDALASYDPSLHAKGGH